MVIYFSVVDVLFQMESSGGEEPENMSTESGLDLHPGGTKARAS